MAGTGNLSRERLLRDALKYVAEHGVADLSLRGLAAAIGTSHRMLIYHFSSKAGLLIELIRAVEDQQRQTMAGFDIDSSMTSSEVARRMWRQLSDPALWPNERLFFEMYGQALQARPHTGDFLDDIVEGWLQPAAAMRQAEGLAPEVARAQARVDLALTRGLLLDLLATGDREGVDQAAEHALTLYETWLAQAPKSGLAPGDHVAALYFGQPERDAIVVAFVRDGLDDGEQCVCLIDEAKPGALIAKLDEGGGTEAHGTSGQLKVAKSEKSLLRKGHFSPERTSDVLREQVEAATGESHRSLRVARDAGWVLSRADAGAFTQFESDLGRFASEHPQVLLCLFDLAVHGESVGQIMRSHNKLLLGGALLDLPN